MAVTRIKNNQITDSTITGGKIASATLTGGLFSPTLSMSSNVTIVGNLTVTGTTSTVSSTNTFINDPLVVYNNGYTGSLSNYSIGMLVNRNLSSLADYGSVNMAWAWDESAGAFTAMATTDTGTGITSINNSGWGNVKLGNAEIVSKLTASSMVITTLEATNLGATTLVATNFSSGNAQVSGGYADGFTIGANTAATATFTDVTSSGTATMNTVDAITTTSATLNSTSGNITTLTSGTVNAGTATAATLNSTSGNVTTLTSTTVNAGTATAATLNSTSGNITTLTSPTVNAGTTTTATLNATTGNVTTATAGSLAVSDLTDNRVVIAGTSGELEDDANFTFNGTTLALTAGMDITGDLDVDNINVNGNSIISTDTDGDINITPDGTGDLVLDGLKWPQADGTSNQAIVTDASGQLSFLTVLTDVVQDATPQLGGDLDVNGNDIVSVSNGNITLTPNGTGDVIMSTAMVSDLTNNRVVIAGVNGALEDDANFTYDGTDLTVNSAIVGDLTDNRVVIAGTSGALEDDANLTYDGTNLTTNGLVATTADINGGTIDGTTIGGTTPAAVTTTSLVATTADIDGGTIDATAIGGTTAAAGAFTTLSASGTSTLAQVDATVITGATVNATTGNVTTLTGTTATYTTVNAGTTTSATVNATTGNVTTLTATDVINTTLVATNFSSGNVDVNGGAIDGTNIGAASAGTGAFTTLTSSGNTTVTSTQGSGNASSGALVVSGGVGIAENLNVGGDTVITGDLTVNGTTTYVNTSDLVVTDKNIQIADGSADADAANGAGITVDLGSDGTATITYTSADDSWNFNKNVNLDSLTMVTLNATNGNITTLSAPNFSSSNVQLTGGYADNVHIGANTAATGTFTTVDATTATVTTVNAGTTTSATLNATTGNVTTISGTTATYTTVNAGTTTSATLNATTGNITTATAGSLAVSDLTDNRVVIAGTSGELEDDANFTFNGTTLALTAAMDITGDLDVDNININGNDITSTNTNGAINLTPDGTGEVVASTMAVSDLTDNRVVIAGTSGALEDDANLTYDGTNLTTNGLVATTGTVTTLNASTTTSATVNATTGNITTLTSTTVNAGTTTSATVNATTGNVTTLTAGSATVSDLTDNRIVIAGTSGALEDDANLTWDGSDMGVTGGVNITGDLAVDNLALNGNDITSTDTNGAINITPDGTGEVVLSTAAVSDLTNNRVVIAGTSGALEDDANFTYDGTDLTVNSAIVGDLTDNRVVIAGTSGALEDDANLTYDGTNLTTNGLVATTGTVTTLNAGTTTSATLNSTTGNITTLTSTTVNAGTTTSATVNATTGNVTTLTSTNGAVTTLVATNFSSGNVDINGGAIDGTNIGASSAGTGAFTTLDASANLAVSGGALINTGQNANYDIKVSGVNDTSLVWARSASAYDAVLIGNSASASTFVNGAKLQINTTDSILLPAGTTAQRPGSVGGTDTTGMLRYNTSISNLEFYDGDSWNTAGTTFTVIASQTFDGDDSTTGFTLSEAQTTASCIVSINGVVQLPSTAYSVSGTTLTFTEAPATGDKIEVRKLTTTQTVTGSSSANGYVQVATDDDGVKFYAGSGAATLRWTINTDGDLIPAGNTTQDIGSASAQIGAIYVAGGTIHLGDIQLKAEGGSLAVYESDGSTPAGQVVSDFVTGPQGDVRFSDADSSNFVAFQAPATVSSNVTWTLPDADASVSGYALVSDGAGTLSWAAAGATISQDEATNTNFNLYFASTTSGALTSVNYDTGLSYNPSTGTLNVEDLVLSGDLTVNGTTTTINTTNTVVSDNLIELNNGATSNANDSGIVIERGSTGDNVFMGWDESADRVVFATTTATGADTGDLTLTMANIQASYAHVTSTQSLYADLAENYQGDKQYAAGTVVEFGGEHEVTVGQVEGSTRVAGIVSTMPGHLMNGSLTGTNVVAVALTGRVPCMVIGPVRKGDMMVSAGFGYAKASANPAVGSVVGKALENFDGDKGVIEVVVGRV